MNLRINNKLEIPVNEIKWRFSRSSGAGGQNVNKTNSRAEIVFNVSESKTLTQYQKHMISIQDEVKLINGSNSIAVQDKRTQFQNRQITLVRLASTPTRAFKATSQEKKRNQFNDRITEKKVESKRKRGKKKKRQ